MAELKPCEASKPRKVFLCQIFRQVRKDEHAG